MKGIQQPPKLAVNGWKNPQQAAVNEGDAATPLAGIAGIKWREKPSAGGSK